MSDATHRVALVQTEPVFGDVEGNLDRTEALLEGVDAHLVVVPELFATGYSFQTRDEALGYAETFPDGPTVERIRRWSERSGGVVVGGFVEKDGDRLYNAAAVCIADEAVQSYRKIHLFGFEPETFDAGDGPLPVFEHEGLRVGVMICFDWMFPEAARVLALEGADVIAHPSNLVLQWCQRAMVTRSLENGVYSVTCNRVGREHRPPRPELPFTGQSVIIDPLGKLLASGSPDTPEILFADLDTKRARNKIVPSGNDRMTERRPDVYGSLLRVNPGHRIP